MESTLSFYLLALLSSLLLAYSQSEYVLPDHYFINCGSNSDVDYAGRKFVGDVNHSSISASGGRAVAENKNSTDNTQSIYRTARVFTKKSWYDLEADGNNTFVMVRLHFSPLSSNEFESSDSKFEVSVSGFSLLSNFNVGNATVTKEFIVPIGSDRSFRIEFAPSKGSSAFVNAIEAFTTPSDLFTLDVPLTRISPAGQSADFEIKTVSYAFIPIHRINVGGQIIEEAKDTLRRKWLPDDPFFFSSGPASNSTPFDGQINYRPGEFASRFDAPDDVYKTAKQLNNKLVSITWNFAVNKNAMYLVRAHFCDFISAGLVDQGDAFNFFVYSYYKQVNAPGNITTGQLAVPFYKDFRVDSGESGFMIIGIGWIDGNNQRPFLNGLEIMKLLKNSSLGDQRTAGSKGPGTAQAQAQAPSPSPAQARGWGGEGVSGAVLTLILGGIAGIILLVLFVILCRKKRLLETRKAANRQIEMYIKNSGTLAPKRYKYSEIKKMTNSFLEKLGQGGYGSVYKGQLHDGHVVAVKLLDGAMGDGEDFINEVASISRTSHVNVVTLFGFCFEGKKKKALIYEFMPHGSLDKFLRGDDSRLDWNTLFQIAKGIARGLEYLHRGCNTRIVHFDIKPHNILLDEEFIPKISDFGLAKLCTRKESIVSVMGARGTAGYMAPEVFIKGLGGASHKSDVYSYGMMIFEMTGARKNSNTSVTNTSEVYFPDWVYKQVEGGDNLGVYGVTTDEEEELARKMMIVSLWCIQSDPSDRPSISKVVEMLEGSFESLQVPSRRFWSSLAQVTSPSTMQSSSGERVSMV